MNANPSEIEIVWQMLEQQEYCENAPCSFDGMSGGFKFWDEIPKLPIDRNDHEFFSAFWGILRRLWAYRISVVLGKPRSELEANWQNTMKAAPSWPGFRSERIDSSMLPFAKVCVEKLEKLSEDLDRLDEQINAKKQQDRID